MLVVRFLYHSAPNIIHCHLYILFVQFQYPCPQHYTHTCVYSFTYCTIYSITFIQFKSVYTPHYALWHLRVQFLSLLYIPHCILCHLCVQFSSDCALHVTHCYLCVQFFSHCTLFTISLSVPSYFCLYLTYNHSYFCLQFLY